MASQPGAGEVGSTEGQLIEQRARGPHPPLAHSLLLERWPIWNLPLFHGAPPEAVRQLEKNGPFPGSLCILFYLRGKAVRPCQLEVPQGPGLAQRSSAQATRSTAGPPVGGWVWGPGPEGGRLRRAAASQGRGRIPEQSLEVSAAEARRRSPGLRAQPQLSLSPKPRP